VISRSGAVRRGRLRAPLVLSIAVGLGCLSSCTRQPAHSDGSTSTIVKPAKGSPLPTPTLRRLPPGIFYLTAGTSNTSFNLWSVTKSNEVERTHNKSGFGISGFAASSGGVVMDDAASGVDQLAELTSNGSRVSSLFYELGDIDPRGRILYIEVHTRPTTSFILGVEPRFGAPGTVVRQQPQPMLDAQWGPNGEIALLSGTHPPGSPGRSPTLLLLKGSKTTSLAIKSDVSSITWSPVAPAIAVGSWDGSGELLYPNGYRLQLPAGWFPLSWSPSGRSLLVRGSADGALGVWSYESPKTIAVIRPVTTRVEVGQVVWVPAS
jgi:WD40 repeat protein